MLSARGLKFVPEPKANADWEANCTILLPATLTGVEEPLGSIHIDEQESTAAGGSMPESPPVINALRPASQPEPL
jgi:hypothetical protein